MSVIVPQRFGSRLHVSRFINLDRPALDHIRLILEVPVDALGNDCTADLKASLDANPNDDYRCAAVGRFWETLLEEHPDVPFVMLRVADMRAALGSKITAIALYEKLHTQVNDPALGAWLAKFRTATYSELRDQLRQYIRDSGRFTPSQRWKSGTCNAPFPYCKLQRSQLASMRNIWNDLCDHREQIMSQYINYHSIETNALEGVVHFDSSTVTRLVRNGFSTQDVPVHDGNITGGAVRDVPEALSILQDTREALDMVIEMIKTPDFRLTVDVICRLHRVLMRTSRVLRIRGRGEDRLSYLNIGVTRQQTYANVTASSVPRQGEKPIVIQFCPYHEVDAELITFCTRFNELAQTQNVDPFGAAAWTSYVFVTIHPFEDGNGRLSRILASIPLLKQGLPLLCVPTDMKSAYIASLNVIRANRDGDYSCHMEDLYSMTTTSFSTLVKLLDNI